MSFDAIAPHYQWLERVTAGPLLQRCRAHFIHEIKDARSILLLGEGRGRFLMAILQQNPEAQITCVDASARMLEFSRAGLEEPALPNRPRHSASCSSSNMTAEDEARGRLPELTGPRPHRVNFVHANILSERLPTQSSPFDAVASHFFLDCFPADQLARVCRSVAAWTVPGAPWLISDFRVPDRGWQRIRARAILTIMYTFFGVVTRLPARRLTPPDTPLKAAGFRLTHRRHFNQGLLHSDVWMKG